GRPARSSRGSVPMARTWKSHARHAAPAPHSRTRPRLEELESRVVPVTTGINPGGAPPNVWPSPQLVTLSFMPDGTFITNNLHGSVYSNLYSRMSPLYWVRSPADWQNVILRAAQAWAQQTNINFAVVSDNGVGEGYGPDQQGDPGHGDIRFGMYDFGSTQN